MNPQNPAPVALAAEASRRLTALRAQRPLVQAMTNYVSMDVAANALLAIGASPAMVHAPEEAEDFRARSPTRWSSTSARCRTTGSSAWRRRREPPEARQALGARSGRRRRDALSRRDDAPPARIRSRPSCAATPPRSWPARASSACTTRRPCPRASTARTARKPPALRRSRSRAIRDASSPPPARSISSPTASASSRSPTARR